MRAAAGALAALMEEAIGAMAGHVPLAVRIMSLFVDGTQRLVVVTQESSRSCVCPYQAHSLCNDRLGTLPECTPSCQC